MKPSDYELKSLREIHEWKKPKTGWVSAFFHAVDWPFAKAGEALINTPLLGELVGQTLSKVTHLLNHVAQWSVRPESIFATLRKDGHTHIQTLQDIQSLDLEQIDKSIAWINVKYESLAAAEGTGAGFAGLPGIPVDIVALMSLNLRAVAEYATYYGFDIKHPEERLFAISILALASSPTDAAKVAAMAQLVKIAQDTAQKKVWSEMQKRGLMHVIETLATTLGVRLTRAKLAQILPVAGAVVGGGFNVYFTNKITHAAYFLYRERFLAAKYGADVIAASVNPAEDLNPHYLEVNESLGRT
ncbi:MAG: EcsC family protein [Candidatus Methylacidiphilales bacterium]|nr:EcsC family protein [Candidatus Methylacidiphilales bacterium]